MRTFGYDGLNRLTFAGGETFGYDARDLRVRDGDTLLVMARRAGEQEAGRCVGDQVHADEGPSGVHGARWVTRVGGIRSGKPRA